MKPENEKIEINEKINSNTQIKKNAISFEINFNDIEVKPKKKGLNNSEKKEKAKNDVQCLTETSNQETQEGEEEIRYECPECGRKFKKEALEKHAPICQKVFQGKREVEITKEEKKDKNHHTHQKTGINKKAKWENQSNELRAIIQTKRAEKGNLLYIL